jgi:hypothetical protein
MQNGPGGNPYRILAELTGEASALTWHSMLPIGGEHILAGSTHSRYLGGNPYRPGLQTAA